MKNQMKEYREAYLAHDYAKAVEILDKSVLKDDKKSVLLWHLEKGTVSLSLNDEDSAVTHFQTALDLVDKLYTKSLSTKAATFLINDASDNFYGANYERSYAHYFLAKSYYTRYLKNGNKLDLQGARATILAWDSYFAEVQRSSPAKTLYQTDLMLKVFGGEIHEVSQIRNDQQIALQLYKDALKILQTQGGIFSVFNKKSTDYVKSFESEGKAPPDKLYESTAAYDDLVNFLHFKILSLTKEVRPFDFEQEAKALRSSAEIKNRASKGSGNVVLVLEEGLIPQKVGKSFNFGLKGATNLVGDSGAKKFIATVGVETLTAFAMNKLGLVPEKATSAGSFIFAQNVTKFAVQEAAVEFELPMIENVPAVQRLEVFITDNKGAVVQQAPVPVVSENGDIARVVLEEDVVARYVKTGSRVAVKHIMAIITALQVYNSLNSRNSGDFIAKSAALATYVGAAKGIAALEKADTRNWSTLPQAFRMFETKLPPGQYKVGVAPYDSGKSPVAPTKTLGDIQVKDSTKTIFTLKI